jgi:AcrR family transcriptional regulator
MTQAEVTQADDGSSDGGPEQSELRGVRRTQAERSAAMRQRLLDATIDCLVTYGYAGTTTQRVAQRAGVTRGAQIHHFKAKEDLVAAAIEHLARRRAQKAIAEIGMIKDNPDMVTAILDFLWSLHQGPIFVATIELWIASRTDRALAAQIERVEPVVNAGVFAAIVQLLPDQAGQRELRHAAYTTMDAIRGLLISSFVDGDQARLQRRWARASSHLRRDIEAALSTGGAS